MENKASYDALLNEYKGNLFEFLVGKEFAVRYGIEKEYLGQCLNQIGPILEQQESFIRNYYPELLNALPVWSRQIVDKFCENYPLKTGVKSITILGKATTGIKDNRFKEADIVIKDNSNVEYPLSLKLAKHGSFVNTKSAGVKSILSKYFQSNEQSYQRDFNKFYDERFEKFSFEMHHEAGISFTGGFNEWLSLGYPSLPGKLTENYRTHLLRFYHDVNIRLSDKLDQIEKKSKSEFISGLLSLSGLSSKEIIQSIFFHKDHSIDNGVAIIKTNSFSNYKYRKEVKKNHIDYKFEKFTIQLRLKPMNQFTSSSYKINCSIKYLI